MEKQQRFVTRMKSVSKLEARANGQEVSLESLFCSLQQRAFAGEL
jgi:hypothetical protein